MTTDFGGADFARALAIQPDGKLVAAGGSCASSCYFALARYNTDGTLDTTFGTGGKLTTDFGEPDPTFSSTYAYALAIQADGKLVAAGQTTATGFYGVALARYNIDGSLDSVFGTDGKVAPPGLFSNAYALAIQADGRIVVAGWDDGMISPWRASTPTGPLTRPSAPAAR